MLHCVQDALSFRPFASVYYVESEKDVDFEGFEATKLRFGGILFDLLHRADHQSTHSKAKRTKVLKGFPALYPGLLVSGASRCEQTCRLQGTSYMHLALDLEIPRI